MKTHRILFCFVMVFASVGLPAIADAQETFVDNGVFVSEGTLDTYVGSYEVSPGLEIKVWREGEQLMLQASGQAVWPLQGISETVFRVQAMNVKVSFGVNAAGEADHLILLMDGRETKAIRK